MAIAVQRQRQFLKGREGVNCLKETKRYIRPHASQAKHLAPDDKGREAKGPRGYTSGFLKTKVP